MAAPPASRMSTRGVKVVLPDYIVPKTRVERSEKKKKAERKKEDNKLEVENKQNAKHIALTTCIGQFMDTQAEKYNEISEMNPDKKTPWHQRKTRNNPTNNPHSKVEGPIATVSNNEAQDPIATVTDGAVAEDSDIDMSEPIDVASDIDFESSSDSNHEDSDSERACRLEEELAEIKRKKKEKKKIGKKRSGSGSTITSAKCSKPNEVGGLSKDWKTLVHGSHKTATSSIALSDAGNFEFEFEDGQFNGDQGTESLEVDRGSKSVKGVKAKRTSNAVAEVKLEESDVNLIAAEEHETGRPARSQKRTRIGKQDLPIVLATDYIIWLNNLLPVLYEWCGSRQNQFQLNGDSEFRPTLRAIWIFFLGNLPHIPDTYQDRNNTAQSQVRTYQSKLGATALAAVNNNLECLDTVEEMKKWLEGLILNDAFLYEIPGPLRSLSSGTYRGKLVMHTLAFHLTWALSAKYKVSFGVPRGALTLSTTAVLRALTVSLNAIKAVENKTKDKTEKNGKSKGKKTTDAFDDESWAGSVKRFWDGAENLSNEKWELIFVASESCIPNIAKAGAGPALKEFVKTGQSNVSEAAASSDADAIVISD